MGEGPGAGSSDPPPRRLPSSQTAKAMGGVQRQGDGHSDHWEPGLAQSCRPEIKVGPSGWQVEGPSPNPRSLARGLRAGGPLEQMS